MLTMLERDAVDMMSLRFCRDSQAGAKIRSVPRPNAEAELLPLRVARLRLLSGLAVDVALNRFKRDAAPASANRVGFQLTLFY